MLKRRDMESQKVSFEEGFISLSPSCVSVLELKLGSMSEVVSTLMTSSQQRRDVWVKLKMIGSPSTTRWAVQNNLHLALSVSVLEYLPAFEHEPVRCVLNWYHSASAPPLPEGGSAGRLPRAGRLPSPRQTSSSCGLWAHMKEKPPAPNCSSVRLHPSVGKRKGSKSPVRQEMS